MTAMNPTAKRPPRTQDELRKAADHVNYEIATLVYAGEELVARPAGSDGDIALESFLLHFRNLRAFLCPTKQRLGDDDVIASDFLNERKGRDLGDWTFLQEHKGKLDKMLAHITYARAVYITSRQNQWDFGGMQELMLTELEYFFSMLPTNVRTWFKDSEWMQNNVHRARVLKRCIGAFATASDSGPSPLIRVQP
jgi:hypothetical protein